uniref:Uncharacterized protein n=1 Tax=viral metagenome TaxID=1070528 RepID=A0A6C0EVY0_9ZZZZ
MLSTSAANNPMSSIGSTNSFSNNIKMDSVGFSPALETSGSSSGFSFSNMFSETTWQTWLIVVLILAVLGFNIFYYLASGTQFFANYITPYIKYFSELVGGTIGNTTKEIVTTSATGTKAGVDITAGTITSSIDALGSAIEGTSTAVTQTGQDIEKEVVSTSPENPLNNAMQQQQQHQQGEASDTFQADDSYSSIQSGKSSSKSGWCYIGEERGIRSCSQVGPNDQCMSGDIFPTSQVCVNPTLRAN